MVGFELYRGGRLWESILQLKKLAQPGNTGTFNFLPDSISLVASSPDGHIIGALEFSLERLYHESICNCQYSIGVNLDHLCTALDVAMHEDFVRISTNEDLSQFIVRMRNVEQENERIRNIDFIPPDPLHVNFEMRMVLPHKFGVRTRISSEIFVDDFFPRIVADGDGNVAIVIRQDEVELIVGAEALRIPKEPNRCVIGGVTDDDDGPYLTEFSLQHLRLLEGSIAMSQDVLIYPPHVDGATKVLKCQILDNIGTFTYYIQ